MICLTTINRFAIILLPMQACMDWIRSCPGGDSCPTLDELRREPTVRRPRTGGFLAGAGHGSYNRRQTQCSSSDCLICYKHAMSSILN